MVSKWVGTLTVDRDMRNKIAKAFVLFSLGITFISCDPATTYKKEIEEIDSCFALVDSLQNEFNGIEFDSLDYMYNHVLSNEDNIKKYYYSDTVNEMLAGQLNDSKSIRKRFKNIELDRTVLQEKLTTSLNQLENLEEDIRNGVLTEDQIKQYLADEKEAANEVYVEFESFYLMQESEKKRFYQFTPAIDAFVEQLLNDNKERIEE